MCELLLNISIPYLLEFVFFIQVPLLPPQRAYVWCVPLFFQLVQTFHQAHRDQGALYQGFTLGDCDLQEKSCEWELGVLQSSLESCRYKLSVTTSPQPANAKVKVPPWPCKGEKGQINVTCK